MLDQLRIQCPSCGIILDVKNSKHEAVKQIVCPNCKKQLAVNFEEELEPAAPPQPIEPLYYGEMRIDLNEGINNIALPNCDKAEIKVVRLKDGNSKCLVRPLSDIPVKVNRQQLQAEEQVALSKGDYLEIGKTVLRAGEPGSISPAPPTPEIEKTSEPQKPKKESNHIWFFTALAFVVLLGATVILWPSDNANDQLKDNKQLAILKDTTKGRTINEEAKGKDDAKGKNKDKGNSKIEEVVEKTPKPSGVLSSLSDFDLEKKALDGSVDAQYELGARLIKRGGINNSIRGIKYLKLAARNGSSKAKTALSKIINSLQQRANDGDSASYYILKKI